VTEPQDESAVLTSKTAAGLLMFYDVKQRKHELADGVVGPLRTATNRVLEVLDADPADVDLGNLDLDELFTRFHNKNRASLTDKSYAAYVSRFRRGLTMYLQWLERDPNWRGKVRPIANNGAVKSKKTARPPVVDSVEVAPPVQLNQRATLDVGGRDQGGAELFDYPVALVDSKVVAILRLPRSYTKGDAERMAALINALAVPDVAIDKA
jgi:hypothetical protein